MKDENERVTVHEIRGFVSDTLDGAFQESYAISRGTRCKQHLYSLSLNPPTEADASPELLIDTVDCAEERLGLQGQPRAIVFHEKIGADGQMRRHAHAVWCRIDTDHMRAVQMSFDRPKLQSLSRDLYREHGWKMPRGMMRREDRNPRNYSLAEWQQAKRAKQHPGELKAMFQDCWAVSDSQISFGNALRENGYILARGDRGGAVAVDHRGEVYAIRQYAGIKSKQVNTRITDKDALPDVAMAHHQAAKIVTDRLKELEAEQNRAAMHDLRMLAEKRRRAQIAQREYARQAQQQQFSRQREEEQQRRERIRMGWRGLIDRITGKRRQILAENRIAAESALRRDRAERAALDALQRAARQELLDRAKAVKLTGQAVLKELGDDIRRIQTPKPEPPDIESARTEYVKDQKRAAAKPNRRRTPTAERKKRRSNNPGYSKDGPTPSR
ncbi:MAG: relaxase [Pseudomonadota bacterium]